MEFNGSLTSPTLYDTKKRLEVIAPQLFQEVIHYGKHLLGDVDKDWLDRSCADFFARPAGLNWNDTKYNVSMLLGGEGPNYSRRDKYRRLAIEKCKRLDKHLNRRHLTSYESQNPEKEQYQGAIAVMLDGVIWLLSMSGLPSEGDEAFNLLATIKFDPYQEAKRKMDDIEEILRRTGNEQFAPLSRAILG